MRSLRVVLFAVLAVSGLLLQVSVFGLLPLPRTGPDVLLVVVVACALVAGPLGGSVTGFLVGLLADVTPPADHTIGRWALVFALVGYAAGMLEDIEHRSVVASMVLVAVATAIGTSLYAMVGALVGDSRVSGAVLARDLPFTVLYGIVLAPFVLPLVSALDRRLRPEGALR